MPNFADSAAPINALPLPLADVGASTETAGSLPYGISVYGSVDAANDRDWYGMQVFQGMTYDFRLLGVGRIPLADPLLYLRDGSGAILASNDDAGGAFGNNAVITYSATFTGYIYVDAGAFRSGTGDFILTGTTERRSAPILSIDEVAWQLTNNFERYFNYSSGSNVPATAYDLSDGRTLTYNIAQLTDAGKALAVQALQMWSDVTGITFAATNGAAELTFDDSDTDVNAYNSNVTLADGTITKSALMISNGWLREFGTTLNSYSFETTLHELGHALGLGHGGNYNGSATYGVDNFYANDSQHLSIMSYMQSDHDEFARDLVDYNTFSNAQFRWVLTPMIADILAMGNLYGLATATRTGNTTYGYNSNTSNAALDAAVVLNDPSHDNYVAFTIFDNGGTDTVDMSGYAGAQRIDLQQGASSDVLGGRLKMGIAYGTVVENAYGGSGTDRIVGNAANNLLRGNNGMDTLDGGAGDDTLGGGAGRDVLNGGVGNDIFAVGTSADDDVYGGLGTDTLDLGGAVGIGYAINLETAIYRASTGGFYSVQGVENVSGSAQRDSITGTLANNVLNGMGGDDLISGGGGNDTLDGGAGHDTLTGGIGGDRYFVNDAQDSVIEAYESLYYGPDIVDSSVDFALPANVEWLVLTGATARNGIGNALANYIQGNEANNNLFGGAGLDFLSGGSGNDKLNGETFEAGFDPAAAQVYRLYQAVLDRAPDPVGQMNWTNRIASGAISLQQAATSFMASAEFQRTFGATSTEAFVTLLYDHVLNRAPDPRGFATWTEALNSGRLTRADVVTGLSESAEFTGKTAAESLGFSRAGLQADWADDVYRLYRATLDRNPDAEGLTSWTSLLSQGRSLLSVVEGFTGSAEFLARYGATSNTDFVTLLYRNVLDRNPDTRGLATWTGYLETATMTRAEVVRGFANSVEFVRAAAADLIDFMRHSMHGDRLYGDAGNDLLFGGLGADTFDFGGTPSSNTTVADLEAWDWVELRRFRYGSAEEIRDHLTQIGDNVVFADLGVTVTFVETTISAMGTNFAIGGW